MVHANLPDCLIKAPPNLTLETVCSVKHWNDNLFSFNITRPASFRFRSGEFVMIGIASEGAPLLRPYSIASPSYSDELEFLSIYVPNGPLTSRLRAIAPGDKIFLGKKATGTLVTDALLEGERLFLLSSGTGLAPFLSIARDPDIYSRFNQIILIHCVRQIKDLAFRQNLESSFADDYLVRDQALLQLLYIPTVTREKFKTNGRITDLLNNKSIFCTINGLNKLNYMTDRVMICGGKQMIIDISSTLTRNGFTEGSNSRPGHFVIEKAFIE
ncbi:ferredoxin--NADP reductase [Sphingobium xenophagum]